MGAFVGCMQPGAQKIGVCALCHRDTPKESLKQHPSLQVAQLKVCSDCWHVVVSRIARFQSSRMRCSVCRGGSDGEVTVPASVGKLITPKASAHENEGSKGFSISREEDSFASRETTIPDVETSVHMLALLERCFLQLSPKALRFFGLEKPWEDWLNGKTMVPRNLVSPDIITILFKSLKAIGAFDEYSMLRWPCSDFELPCDVMQVIALDSDERFESLSMSRSPKLSAWNDAFPQRKWPPWGLSECIVYNKLFGLIGVKLDYVNQGEIGSRFKCRICEQDVTEAIKGAETLAGKEVSKMIRACFHSLLSQNQRQKSNDLEGAQVAIPLGNEMVARDRLGDMTSDDRKASADVVGIDSCDASCDHIRVEDGVLPSLCCLCGCQPDEKEYPLSMAICKQCFRNFCSICVCRVFGDVDYIRALRLSSWCCLSCRQTDHTIQGRMIIEENQIALFRKLAGSYPRPQLPPLLIVSEGVQKSLQRLHDEPLGPERIRFVAHCEQLNREAILESRDLFKAGDSLHRCIACRFPLSTTAGLLWNSIPCSEDSCFNYIHRECIRGKSRSSWECGWHRCSKCCNHKSSSILARCRTCSAAYCESHTPPKAKAHVYGRLSMACEKCSPLLEKPLHPPRKIPNLFP